MFQVPVLVLKEGTKRESGHKAQLGNITAAKAVSDTVRTTLGPRAMLKMVLDAMGGIVLTNDGNAVLREIDVSHPAAKSMIELSRTQDEEVGDGTTSVIVLAGELLSVAEPFIERGIHPRIVVNAYFKALDDAVEVIDKLATKIDPNDNKAVNNVIASCIGTKYMSRHKELMCELASTAVRTIATEVDGHKVIDIKNYARIEKVPGGGVEDSCVLRGVMFDKDVTHPKMRRKINNPKILLLDCPLEYTKLESQANVEIAKESDWEALLKQEETYVEKLCSEIVKLKPDLVITEKGVSDLAQHYLMKANISCIRRVKKTENNRIAKATGATIVSRAEEAKESDLGIAGLFEVKKIGDEYFTFITECASPKACTILLRGASKDVLNEIERNLQDALCVARNIMRDPRIVPGGGATEMFVSKALGEKAKSLEGVIQFPYRAVSQAMEVIPRTLLENCGANVVRALTELRAKYASGKETPWGVNGQTGEIVDMSQYGIWEPYTVKVQTIKTAVESAALLLRIDDIVSGISKKKDDGQNASQPQNEEE
ncbi:T-complex protein 1 subunit gamma [Galdieria sulphuraria]|uniref:T-complex protein 1 subunit gamma n=1 Tax=Galdieria sulphuraria TaxID=130081 RepID=M2XVQ5_GALSU|nr:T-complex protein 1 subunit isoform 1 [Galdieria sulphuraria]EME27733.1 T-complex protein 1 subunit isoform 1 [Galdieria sulphuraria]GJD10143.1 T-complex protein 1 subunit gamma [Galdieria sulphuraria]|eukprot:XP_005704253.1 T-complex protein 1 subunit isoform 1 [Galdieria sulphuraria]